MQGAKPRSAAGFRTSHTRPKKSSSADFVGFFSLSVFLLFGCVLFQARNQLFGCLSDSRHEVQGKEVQGKEHLSAKRGFEGRTVSAKKGRLLSSAQVFCLAGFSSRFMTANRWWLWCCYSFPRQLVEDAHHTQHKFLSDPDHFVLLLHSVLPVYGLSSYTGSVLCFLFLSLRSCLFLYPARRVKSRGSS